MDFLSGLVSSITGSLSESNPGALATLFIVSALTEVGVPFPFLLDTVLIYAGYQFGILSPQVGAIILALLFGREVGAGALYWVSRLFGDPFIRWVGKKFPRLTGGLDRVMARLNHRVPVAVAIARLTPGILSLVSIASGTCRLSYWHFVLGVVLASAFADGILILSGVLTRHGFDYFGINPPPWLVIAAFLTIILLVWWATSRFVHMRNQRGNDRTPAETGSSR
jgi:membrane protein DedA with SNARE-associated domain